MCACLTVFFPGGVGIGKGDVWELDYNRYPFSSIYKFCRHMFVRFFVCVFVRLFCLLMASPSACSPACLSVYLSISVLLSSFPTVYICLCDLSVCLSTSLPVRLPACRSASLSVYLLAGSLVCLQSHYIITSNYCSLEPFRSLHRVGHVKTEAMLRI